MKTILVYSAKGGVGKSSCSAAISRFIANKCEYKSVLVIDMDINTPSMDVIFKNEHPKNNIWVCSTGFMFESLIYMDGSMIKEYISHVKKTIRKIKPDYVIIDTPPSLSQVHIELINSFKISYIFFVTQPTILSISDVNRTIDFFVSNIGATNNCSIIENMCSNFDERKYKINISARIGLQQNLDGFNLETKYPKEFENIFDIIEKSCDFISDGSEDVKRMMFDESFDIKTIQRTNGRRKSFELNIVYDDGRESVIYLNELKFISVRTWNTMKYHIESLSCSKFDMRLQEFTKVKIERLVNAFKERDVSYFMVTNSPITEIRLIPGEIGQCTIKLDDFYYGVPKVEYSTPKGAVTLFPNEVMPVDMEFIQNAITNEGYSIIDGNRFIPPIETVVLLMQMFGGKVGAYDDVLDTYNRLIKNRANGNK